MYKYLILFLIIACKPKYTSPMQENNEAYSHLNSEEKEILFNKGTESPFSGKYNTHFKEGVYHCKACNEPLFNSNSKFESNCGWPSFDDEVEEKVEKKLDTSHGMNRVEILCKNCGGHLGHIFNDGPTNTGKRYCVNSLSINFKEKK